MIQITKNAKDLCESTKSGIDTKRQFPLVLNVLYLNKATKKSRERQQKGQSDLFLCELVIVVSPQTLFLLHPFTFVP